MRPYGLVGLWIGQDRLAKTLTPYIIYRGCACACACVCACADINSTSTENERNHEPNLLLYILFIYGRMGCNLRLCGKSAKMLNLVMKIIFKMS